MAVGTTLNFTGEEKRMNVSDENGPDRTQTPQGDPHQETDQEGLVHVAGLLMKFRTDLYAYLLAAIGSHHDAEDLLQEVSLSATRSWKQFRPGTDFRAWAREIARRRILEYAKRRSRRMAIIEPEILERLAEAARKVEQGQPLEPLRDALRECMKRLQGVASRVITQRYECGMQVTQIAEGIGKTTQATYALLKRARQALRECTQRRLVES